MGFLDTATESLIAATTSMCHAVAVGLLISFPLGRSMRDWPAAQDDDEAAMDRAAVRFSVDLVPAEYTLLCAVQQERLRRGERISLRNLVREAIRAHYAFPEAGSMQPAPEPSAAPVHAALWRDDLIRYDLLLPPRTYALLARVKHARRTPGAGRRISFRTLILEAIHTLYGLGEE